MRIIAGKFRGRVLAKSDHLKGLRPTTDKSRETLFNILRSGKFANDISFEIEGANVLDVCCGSGAVGFEALSRGAKSVTFIDNNPIHLDLVKQNSESLEVQNSIKIIRANVLNMQKNEEFFDFIFIDPPYAQDIQLFILVLLEKNWIQKKSSLIVAEFETKSGLDETLLKDFKILEIREYGKTSFAFLIIRAEIAPLTPAADFRT